MTLPMLYSKDVGSFLLWWGASILFGIGFYPLGAMLFRTFDDKGWLFSKALGIGAGGYLVFLAGRFRILPFRGSSCIVITLAAAALCWILFLLYLRENRREGDIPFNQGMSFAASRNLKELLLGELFFFLVFLFWTWCSGFRPAAAGTEKPMDYGFMAAMMRSETIPARDIWYSQGTLNYYYGGQFYAVYLTKLTFTRVNETYHLMRSLVAAFCFSLSRSLIRQALKDRGISDYSSGLGGLFAGMAVSFAGNVHYLLYGLLGPVFRLSGWKDYWFPSSTRYIGHNPLTKDQCIHEFPSYSIVLGDLHAHMINLFLVLTFIGMMYAWFQAEERPRERSETSGHFLHFLLSPYILTAGILIGIFKWTNYWDFIIYFTVFLFTAVCIFCRNKKADERLLSEGYPASEESEVPVPQDRFSLRKRQLQQVLAAALFVFVLQQLTAWPFTSQFDSMFKGIGIAYSHTPLVQLLILWGLPFLTAILLAAAVIRKGIHRTDVFFVMLAVCGLGLVFIPELVYVRDIYEDGYARCNTMFKLTYQAYVMLGLMMSYTCFRILCRKEKLLFRVPAAICAGILFLTFGYGGYAVNCWFGNIFDSSRYQGLDAEAYLETGYPTDASAIRWLEQNVTGQPVVLEAPGSSYSTYCRVSAMTGLPTPEGWYVHEWLWRDDPGDLNQIKEDISKIYTFEDPEAVRFLLEKYGVSYIFIGSCERETYGADLKEGLLRSLGTVCYDGEEQGIEGSAVIIQIADEQIY